MSYLELVEEFPKNPDHTLFEKILVAARRAKDLHEEDRAPLAHNHLTAAYTALQEYKEKAILPTYRKAEPVALIEEEPEESEEEE
jgi:DNA-directed RNA polymerase subunit K/omega